MDYKQAADILDPATSREALMAYAYDPQYQQMLLRDACRIAAQMLRSATDTNVGGKTKNESDDVAPTIFLVFSTGFKAGKDGKELLPAYDEFWEKINLEE